MVTVVGAGFTGLTLAFELTKLGVDVQVFERDARVGGRLQTLVKPEGLVETAANALLNDANVEDLFRELGVVRAVKLETARRRFIFRDGPKRWPLSARASVKLAAQMTKIKLGDSRLKPRVGESVRAWGERFVGPEFVDQLLAPALQGVYAGEPERLSAQLTVGSFFGKKPPRAQSGRGSVAPALGMGAIFEALRKRLGPNLKHEAFAPPVTIREPTVICTSAWDAGLLVSGAHPELAESLRSAESLPLTSVTSFYEPTPKDLSGFGCLFPKSAGFGGLGVLFNTDIFAARGNLRSETWISRDVKSTDEELKAQISKDRQKLCASTQHAIATYITRWPRAIPYYTTEWEAELARLKVEPPLYLHGNYLGRLGLSRLLEKSKHLAQTIKDRHG